MQPCAPPTGTDTPAAFSTCPIGARRTNGTSADAAEVRRLRCAITALADQDATLSVCDGSVTVTMDATLTADERAAVAYYVGTGGPEGVDAVLVALLERTA